MKPFLLALALTAVASAGSLDDLIPRLADEIVTNRYAAQMELQTLASQVSRPGNERARAVLGAALAAKAADPRVPQPARVWMVRQLEYMGRGEAVSALTALLNESDAELRECARRALEKNPDPKATDSLRAALQRGGDSAWKIGLVHSLGERRDPKAVPLIAPLLSDPQVGGAAAKALGQIATPEAVNALWNVFDSQPLAAGSLVCAAHQLKSVAIARRLYSRSRSSATRAAVLSLLARSDPALLEEALIGSDLRLQQAAVEASEPAALASRLSRLPSTAKVFALRVIESEQAVINSVADPDESVRVAALEALGRIGSAASVPALIKAAVTGNEEEKRVAAASLAVINGRGAGEAIERQAAQGDSAARAAAIQALAARNATAAVPALLRYAAESETIVSRAALVAVGKLGGDESLDALIQLVLAGKDGAKEALQSVASRSGNKSLIGQRLAAQTRDATGAQLAALLHVMALVGGPQALDCVSQFASSAEDDVKDAAIRALCQWRDFSATAPLIAVAATPGVKPVHQVLAIQAVCQLVRNASGESAQARVDAALAALKAAGRDQERKQAVSALATIPDRKAAEAVLQLLANSSLKKDAAEAALSLADTLRKKDRGTARRLAEAVKRENISPELNKRADQSLNKK